MAGYSLAPPIHPAAPAVTSPFGRISKFLYSTSHKLIDNHKKQEYNNNVAKKRSIGDLLQYHTVTVGNCCDIYFWGRSPSGHD